MPHKNEHKNTIQGTEYPPISFQEIPGMTMKLNRLQSQDWHYTCQSVSGSVLLPETLSSQISSQFTFPFLQV